jgi:hypothetical protein
MSGGTKRVKEHRFNDFSKDNFAVLLDVEHVYVRIRHAYEAQDFYCGVVEGWKVSDPFVINPAARNTSYSE